MPQQGITFDGAYIGLPGAYYGDDVSPAAPNTPPVTPPLLFLGYGWGQKPQTAVEYDTPADLLAALRGGPAADYVPFITSPSPQLNGAQRVTFIDVSTNTQSNLSLAASGALGTQTLLTSTKYGPPSNLLTALLTSGTTAGLKLTVTDNYGGSQVVGDNLTAPFQLAYSGSASGSLSYAVVVTGSSPSFVLTSPNTGESVSLNISSGGFSTVASLVEAINGTGHWLAQGLSSTNGQLPSQFLTPTGSVTLSPLSGTVAQYSYVRAYLNEIAYWAVQFAGTLVSASVSGSAQDVAAWLPVTGASPAFFSGAAGTPPTTSDYASGFNLALTVPGWTVFCDSNATAVQALLAQHCETASSPPYGMWRRGFTGSSAGDSLATTLANAAALDTLTVAYLYPGIYRTDTATGQNKLYDGLHVAAAAAGMATGNQVAIPLTNKVLTGNGVESPGGTALTASQLQQLQNGGVMAAYVPPLTGVPTLLSDVDTWQVDANVENTSFQQVACRFWLAYSVVNALRPFVGTIASPITEAAILNALKRTLNALIYTGGASNGVLAGWDTGSLTLTYDGQNQLASVTFSATLVGQNRYITAFASIQPLNFTISAA